MALTLCPECELQVSDKASICPHCGYPLKGDAKPRKSYTKGHMRLPNGFGQITELKDRNLRNPYRAMVTVGKTPTGKPISKILKPQGYFKTYNEAYAALVEYNKNPYDLEDDITTTQLYEKWTDEYFKKLKSKSSERTITAAWAYCGSVYSLRAKDIHPRHIKGCIDSCDSPSTKGRIKSLFNLMLDYALEHEIVSVNYSRNFNYTVESSSEAAHKAFSDEELNKLWNYQSIPFICYIIVQCYTGFRPQELCLLKTENINIKDGYIKGGMKTKAGTDRIVPIHPKIAKMVQKLKDVSDMFGCETFVCDANGQPISYDKYYKRFMSIMKDIGIEDHRPHDPRKTFVTMAKNKGVDEYAIKRIVGHQISDITEKIYTERDINWLKEEIEKI